MAKKNEERQKPSQEATETKIPPADQPQAPKEPPQPPAQKPEDPPVPAPSAKEQKPEKPKKYRYVGKTIMNFGYKGSNYQIKPNAVMNNLPLDAPQVQRMIQGGELQEI